MIFRYLNGIWIISILMPIIFGIYLCYINDGYFLTYLAVAFCNKTKCWETLHRNFAVNKFPAHCDATAGEKVQFHSSDVYRKKAGAIDMEPKYGAEVNLLPMLHAGEKNKPQIKARPIEDSLVMAVTSRDILEVDLCCPSTRRIRPYTSLVNLFNINRTVVQLEGQYQFIHESFCIENERDCGCVGGRCLGKCHTINSTQYILVYNETMHVNFEPFNLTSHCSCLNLI